MSCKLLPCPFCGGEAIAFHCAGKYLAKCIQCQVEIVRSTREETDAAWNRRAQPDNETQGLTAWETPESCPNCNEHLSKDWSYCPECGCVTDWADSPALTLEELRGMLEQLEEERQQAGDGYENYTNGYRWGHRNGQIEMLRQILKVGDGGCESDRRKPEPEGGEDA